MSAGVISSPTITIFGEANSIEVFAKGPAVNFFSMIRE